METSDKKPSAPAPESRFTVSPMTLAADRWMGRLIRFGGVGVVLAVFGMLAFLIFQVFPLFVGAKVAPVSALTVPAAAAGFGEDMALQCRPAACQACMSALSLRGF